MDVIYTLWAYLCMIALFTQSIKSIQKRRKIQTIYAGLGLWIVQALRSQDCGVDLVNDAGTGYIWIFENIRYYSFGDFFGGLSIIGFEPGWLIYNKFISLFTTDSQLFLAIVSATIISLVSYTIFKHSQNIILSFFIFACFGLYHFSFSGIRQATAFAITFFAFNFIREKRSYKFILLVLIASTMHKSALVFMIALLLRNVGLKKVRGIALAFCSVAIVPFLSTVLPLVKNVFFGAEKYSNYEDEGGSITMYIVFLTLFLIFNLQKKFNDDKDNQLIKWMILIGVMCQSLGFISTGAMTRIAYYFTIFFTLAFPSYIVTISKQSVRITVTVGLVIILMLFYQLTSGSGYLNVIPYKFFWE